MPRRAKSPRGLPPILLEGEDTTQTGRPLKQLSRRQAYGERIAPLSREEYKFFVNPITRKQAVRLRKDSVDGSPDPETFDLPADWKLERRPRRVVAKDNYYVGPCKKPGGKKRKPNLRSLSQVYECYYTENLARIPFCRGHPKYQPDCAVTGERPPQRRVSRQAEPMLLPLPEELPFLNAEGIQAALGELADDASRGRFDQNDANRVEELREQAAELEAENPELERIFQPSFDIIDQFLLPVLLEQ